MRARGEGTDTNAASLPFGRSPQRHWLTVTLCAPFRARLRRLKRNLAFDSHEEASAEGRASEEHASLYALTSSPGGVGGGASLRRGDGASVHTGGFTL